MPWILYKFWTSSRRRFDGEKRGNEENNGENLGINKEERKGMFTSISLMNLKGWCGPGIMFKEKEIEENNEEMQKPPDDPNCTQQSARSFSSTVTDDPSEILSVSSYMSATSKGMSSAKSLDSVSNGDTRSMVTAVSGSADDENRCPTPTEENNSISLTMKEEIARLKEENKKLKEERERWTLRQAAKGGGGENEQTLVQMLEERLNEAEACIQDYRDENTVLKCELRELQESGPNVDSKLSEKIKTTEGLCEELMEENEQLKAEVRDLQNEVEEMQDQYREEEIEEFRELQRELEQNAKNCRVLQFKLRKSERQKEVAESEKTNLASKLQTYASDGISPGSGLSENTKIRELESDLRIAKEVSVRLHTELEQSEDKRYKLEDEVFYMKEKVRELQTQNKWRENRNRADNAVKRLSAELAAAAPMLPPGSTGDTNKELRDALEREIDIREQLKFSEEDLKRTQLRLQDIENENEGLLKKLQKLSSKRPPMVRSASEGNAQIQLELAEHEVQSLNSKVERLERTNDMLTKKIVELELGSAKRGQGLEVHSGNSELAQFQATLTPEMERDMSNLLATIGDLERKNLELNMQLRKEEGASRLMSNVTTNNATTPTPAELREEKEKRRKLETEVTELKQALLKSDDQRLIAMATKVEVLNNQLTLTNERCNVIHQKCVRGGEKYSEELKRRVDFLERQLSESSAKNTIESLQHNNKTPTVDEIEQCCEVLASVEAQTSRICKQIEKLENAQKDERRRSLSKDSSATIIAELANLMGELKSVHKLLDDSKLSNPNYLRRSPAREATSTPKPECSRCKENEKCVEEQQEEICFYKKKNKDLTEQVLQTEDRWTIEIEKQRQIFENEIKSLNIRLSDAKRMVEEQEQLLEVKSSTLIEKTKSMEEVQEKIKKLQRDLDEKKKVLQETESDKKTVKEYEIKHNKLESIFDQEREKMNSERQRAKNEIIALKKIGEDAEFELKKVSEDLRKKELAWKTDRSGLEREIALLKKQIQAVRNGEGSIHEEPKSTGSSGKEESEMAKLARHESDKVHLIDLRKEIALLEKRVADQAAQNEDLKIGTVDLKNELEKTKSGWSRDKEAFQHKCRQTEKIRTVEMDALQQKFSSRMRIMEDTNKSLHTQLVLARRERDAHKDSMSNFERKMLEEKKNSEKAEKESVDTKSKSKEMQKRLGDVEAEMERVNTDLRLTKEARKADQILWNIERSKGKNEKISQQEQKNAERVHIQYQEYEQFYSKEVERLNDRIRELTKDSNLKQVEMSRIIKDLKETIRVLEIEQRNLSQIKDNQLTQKEMLEAEAERLQQAVHLSELQKLTRKYRLSSIIDQLQYVTDPLRRAGRIELDHPDSVKYIISQLMAIRDEDNQNNYNGDDRCPSTQPSISGYRMGGEPSISEAGPEYDNISQSSFSIRSTTSIPVRGTVKWTANAGTTSISSLSNGVNAFPKRSFSVENTTMSSAFDRLVDGRGKSPQKKSSNYPDPPPNFILNKNTAVEYDKDGRIHYVPKQFPRSTSFDRSRDEEEPSPNPQRKTSAGTNILYQVRREELARGGQPSVKLMAKAFDSIDMKQGSPSESKKGFFGIRKSRSVETTQDSNGKRTPVKQPTPLKHNQSMSQIDDATNNPYGTLPRGGRNPFKNMGSKLVERVRRSLSRSSRGADGSRRESDDRGEIGRSNGGDGEVVPVQVLKPPKKEIGKPTSPKKTKKKAAESKEAKAKKVSLDQVMNGTQ
ncbi:unnamed protein product, partial [Mesorhabditis belari]|uniref:Uncharacterized protein n=1 Tax=Mesorhabditis belari TaxID=2138241 RepID=A0AAF3EYR2_9BILA